VLKLSEHGLTEDRGDGVVQEFAIQVVLKVLIGIALKEVVGQELLVKGGGNFSFKDSVVVMAKGVIPHRIPGVHGMTGLVSQGEKVSDIVGLVVE
jgi:hypothetical protein